MGELTSYRLSEIGEANCRIWGRYSGKLDPLALFWTGSGIEWNVQASELWVDVETDYDCHEQWMSVLVNGAHVSRQMLPKGRSEICLFRNMNSQETKTIRLMKDVQAMSDDERACFLIHGVRTDGTFHPVEPRAYKFEFIGDSITSGEGTIGAKKEWDWISMFFSSVHDYATLVSEACGAECHIISQSGWGTLTGWDNDPRHALPLYYEKVCGLLKGERNLAYGAGEDYDFSKWQPDAVIVNLGTNDMSAFDQPEWRDDKTGQTFKQHKDEDGSLIKEDAERFEQAVVGFLGKLRTYNPKAHLVWTYGMLGSPLLRLIEHAVLTYRAQTGDENVAFVLLPDTTSESVGSREHPGKKSHEAAAQVLTNYLKAYLAAK
ncbi:MAG: SGNH/GDSL hydrolase family protein [Lachnospiraceae bacterium]|nr:SGNH/GDSL hydrolase family protein [Lachnospiraceae bacterium]